MARLTTAPNIDADFDRFYESTGPALVRQLHAYTGNFSEAQDCVQEAYARAWQRWSVISGYDEPVTWVRVVAIRIAINRYRRARNLLTAYARHGVPPDTRGPEPDSAALVDLLRRLPTAHRQAVVMHHLMDLPVAEIATLTGTKEGTVKAHLSRGRAALAKLLTDPTGESHA